jgi:hypothetical protein
MNIAIKVQSTATLNNNEIHNQIVFREEYAGVGVYTAQSVYTPTYMYTAILNKQI